MRARVTDEEPPKSLILDCGHCGNRAPHSLVGCYRHQQFFDQIEDEKPYETFTWLSYACGTCGGLNVYGDFYGITGAANFERTRIHPRSSNLLPPPHMISPSQPIPGNIIKVYEEIWPLRHRAPAAFAGQIRRLLEFVCSDQGASGGTLFQKLKELVSKGVFPGYFENITDLLRVVGNIGAHSMQEDVSVWDAELIEDFFRSVIDYVYVAPAKIRRMRERLPEAAKEAP